MISMISFLYSAIAKATWFNSSCDSDFHFGLMAIAALFGGFLYTNYLLLADLVEHPKIAELNLTSVIEIRNQRIRNGVISAVFSALASLCLVLFSQPSFIHGHGLKSIILNWKHYLYLYIQNAEVVFLICMVFFFIRSFKDMDRLLRIIREPSSKIDDQKLTTDNPIIEALNAWIKEELFLDFDFTNASDVPSLLDSFVHYFNSDRPAAALGYKSPV